MINSPLMTIQKVLQIALEKLAVHYDSQLEAEILLCYLLGKNRAYLFAHPEEIINPTQINHYLELITKRAMGMPIAYLTQSREFWSLAFKVNQHTLIPRHETELLVELALKLIPDLPETRILDLGTGSGVIALALAKERPHWKITACDINEQALEIAKENAQSLGIDQVAFYHSNWFNQLPDIAYHAIISNPPYVAEQDPHLKQGDLRFEPQNALASGQDGLADLQYIINQSKNYLLPHGLLLVEHGYNQKSSVRAILKANDYNNVHSWQDLQGQDRASGGWHFNKEQTKIHYGA